MKKILKALIIIILVIAIIPAGVFVFLTLDTVIPDRFNYVVNEDQTTCTIISAKNKNSYSIDIPEEIDGYTVTKITSWAFKGHKCSIVFFPDTIEYIGAGAFAECEELGAVHGLEKCTKLKEIQQETFLNCYDLDTIMLPEGLETIGVMAFMNCWSDLNSIKIPSTVTTIEYGAFSLCTNLTEIEFPASVEYIGERVLTCSYNLEAIKVDPANQNYCSVDGVLYSKDMKTLHTYPSGKQDKEFTIPDSVTRIGIGAFESPYYLETLNVPVSMISINKLVISDYDNKSKLTTINYSGTVEMWNSITKAEEWDVESPNYTIYCTDGTIKKDGTVTYY